MMDRDELLQKYLNNELSETEEAQFTEFMQDKDFAEDVEAATILKVDSDMAYKQHLLTLIQTDTKDSEAKVIPINSKTTKRPNYLAWAAIILLLITTPFAIYKLSDNSNPSFSEPLSLDEMVSTQLAEAFPVSSFVRDNSSSPISLNWEKAKQAYKNKEYKSSGDYIEKVIAEPNAKGKTEYQLYLGLSRLYQKAPDYPTAIKALKQSKSQTAQWHIILAYIKNQEHNKAKEELAKFIDPNDLDSWKQEEARALQKKL